MIVKMLNFWYFFWIVLTIGAAVGLYFALRNRSDKTKKIVLWSILVFALVLHFLKALFPPYSVDQGRLYRDSWFVNICGANIALFPFFFLSKNKYIKDYMFYIGVLSGLISLFYPMEVIIKSNPTGEWLDVVRFYIHHGILWIVPLNMVLLKLHELEYLRLFMVPVCLLGVMLFIMLNQIFQSELGYIPLRGDDMLDINYKNSSMIWGPDNDLGWLLIWCVPKVFRTIPVGPMAGAEKYWPWFWLIVPAFVILTPICFAICMIFQHKDFVLDCKLFVDKLKTRFGKPELTDEEYEEKYWNIPEKYRPKRKSKKDKHSVFDIDDIEKE